MIRRHSAALTLLGLLGWLGAAAAPAPVAVLHYEPDGKLIQVQVRVNGSRLLGFVLDTGARHSVVDTATAKELGLKIVSSDRQRGAGRGTVTQQHGFPVDISIGNARLHVEDPWIIDLRSAGMAKHEDGLIGEDIFARYVVRIDPATRSLALYEPATFKYDGTGSAIPLIATDGRLFVDMTLTLPGDVPTIVRTRVDTGSEDAVSDNLVRQSPERRKSVQGVGLGTPYIDYSGVYASVQIGPYAIQHVWGPSGDPPAVGMEILQRFTLTFDVPHGRLYLEPNARLRLPVPTPAP